MAVKLPQATGANCRRDWRDSHRSARIAGRGKDGEQHMDIHGSLMLIVAGFHLVVVVPTVHFVFAVMGSVTIWQVR
jgi:hypothetical protein